MLPGLNDFYYVKVETSNPLNGLHVNLILHSGSKISQVEQCYPDVRLSALNILICLPLLITKFFLKFNETITK